MATRSRFAPPRCTVPSCSCAAGQDGIFCDTHRRKIGKQRLQRVYLWRDRIRSDPTHRDIASWTRSYDYALNSAATQAAAGGSARRRETP